MLFKIESTSNHEFATKPETYIVNLDDMRDVKDWVINHLDCSRSWSIKDIMEGLVVHYIDNMVIVDITDAQEAMYRLGRNDISYPSTKLVTGNPEDSALKALLDCNNIPGNFIITFEL